MKRILFAPEPPTAAAGGGGAAPSPAPATPAPVAAPSPSTPPPPASATPEPSGGGGDNPFADLDKAFKAAGTDIPDKPITPPKEPAGKPAAAAPVSPKPGDVDKKVGAPGDLNWNSAPKELRARKEALESELATSKKDMEELRRKVTEFESKGKDTTNLLAQIDTERKEKEGLMAEIRMLKQETSPDFKEKYDKPFNRQADYAQQAVNGIEKQDGTAFTWEKDFAALYRLPYAAARAKAIEELGPENAQTVMDEIRDLKKLDFVRGQALADEKKQWAERTKADEAKAAETKAREAQTRQQRTQEYKTLWQKVNTDLEGSVKEYALPADDKELNEARAQSLAINDSGDQEKDFTKSIQLRAHIRQRAAMFAPNQIHIARLTAEVAKLKAALDDKNPPPPGGGKRPGGHDNTQPVESWEDGLRKAASGA